MDVIKKAVIFLLKKQMQQLEDELAIVNGEAQTMTGSVEEDYKAAGEILADLEK